VNDKKAEDLYDLKMEDLYRALSEKSSLDDMRALADELRLLRTNIIGSMKNEINDLHEQNGCLRDELDDMRGFMKATNSTIQELAEELNKKGTIYICIFVYRCMFIFSMNK
jgi:predicted  nucleic acid-binding Zn-ribbon protein